MVIVKYSKNGSTNLYIRPYTRTGCLYLLPDNNRWGE
uniref:Uncharacterized protein n=1 Tax=Arundo donax TaxID=35708 RepID=A0A0A9HIH9_ARUDO